jgi:hypothetical protein
MNVYSCQTAIIRFFEDKQLPIPKFTSYLEKKEFYFSAGNYYTVTISLDKNEITFRHPPDLSDIVYGFTDTTSLINVMNNVRLMSNTFTNSRAEFHTWMAIGRLADIAERLQTSRL